MNADIRLEIIEDGELMVGLLIRPALNAIAEHLCG